MKTEINFEAIKALLFGLSAGLIGGFAIAQILG